jgi:hypothetical protein
MSSAALLPSTLQRLLSALNDRLLRLLTPERIRGYPLVAFAVIVCIALYDRLSGHGWANGLSGYFGGDFLSFYTGGALLARGDWAALSNPDAQLAFQEQLLGSKLPGVAVWVSPPYFAWLFVPLSRLPYVWAFVVLELTSLVLLWLSLCALSRTLGGSSSGARMLWIGAQFYPLMEWLLDGQMTGLWLSVLVLVFVLLRDGRDLWAGLLLGCFACKPQLALGLAVALLCARRFRALSAAAAVSLALLALGFLATPEAMRAYFRSGGALLALVRNQGYHTMGLSGSFEFCTLLFDGVSTRLAAILGFLAMLALLGAIAAIWVTARWEPGTRAWDMRMAATLGLGLIASPHLYNYDLALLLLPLFIATTSLPLKNGVPLEGGPLLVLTAIIWALGLVGPLITALEQHVTRLLFGFPSALQLGVIAIAAWCFLLARRIPIQPPV